MYRLSQVARKLNVGSTTILDFLKGEGHEVDSSPNSKITSEQFELLSKEYASSVIDKEEASSLTIGSKHSEDLIIKESSPSVVNPTKEEDHVLITDNILKPHEGEVSKKEDDLISKPKLEGTKVIGKIDLEANKSESKKVEIIEKVEEIQPLEEPQDSKKILKADVEISELELPIDPAVSEEAAKDLQVDQVFNEVSETPVVTEAPLTPEEEEEEVEKSAHSSSSKTEVSEEETPPKAGTIKGKAGALKGLKVLGKIELPAKKK
ncbi:MAG: hypothetical protein CBD44_02475, partial [Flavobacteriaceae bacterium TMED184]